MSDNNQEPKRRGRPRKTDSELTNNPNANNVRAYRERKRLENEAKLLEDQRVYKNMYNKEWETIRANKPDYSKDRSYEELSSERYNKHKAPEPDSNSDTNSDKDDSVSVKSSEQLENILNEAVDEDKQELTKQQRKNLKRRNRLKQLKKGNKITEADTLHEDVD